jgi:hypothetical protein
MRATRYRLPAWQWVITNPVALAALFFGLLLLRRGQQLFSPQVWDEDGTQIIRDFINEGAIALFKPVNGYLVLAPKLISWLSLSVSFSFYPYVSTILTWAFILAVLLLIALYPSKLSGGVLLSLCVLLVPTHPEVFGIPLASLWWASLLLLVVLFWDEQAGNLPLRIGCIVLGGLSSPTIMMVTPLFWARVWLYRGLRREWLLAGVASLCFVAQLCAMMQTGVASKLPRFTAYDGLAIFEKFFGLYAIGQMRLLRAPALLAAASVLVLGVAAVALWRQRKTTAAWFLGYLLLGSIALSVSRVSAAVLHPLHGGPRYFFLPYILLSWLLLQVACRPTRRLLLRRTAQVILVIAAVNALPHLWSTHDELNWRNHVASSIHFDRYAIPIEAHGAACELCYLPVRGTQAATLLARDPLGAWSRSLAVYPYAVVEFSAAPVQPHVASTQALRKNEWQKVTTSSTAPARFAAFRATGQADARSLTFRLHRGDCVLFRSSPKAFGLTATIEGADHTFATELLPSTAWKWLTFSNRLLPATLTVTLRNRDPDPQQWAEVAFAP